MPSPSSAAVYTIFALALSVGCGGAPSQPDATGGPTPVSGALTQTDAGWRFRPEGGEPLPVPAEVVAVIDQIVAGEVTPGRATLVLDPGGRQVVGWRCVGCGGVADDVEWAMHGNEPFWGLVIRGGSATWSSPDEDAPLMLSAKAGPDGLWTLTGDDGATMTARIEEAACDDSMADARWHATAHVERDGIALRGCAMRGR